MVLLWPPGSSPCPLVSPTPPGDPTTSPGVSHAPRVSPPRPPGATCPLLTAACCAEQRKMIMVTNFTSSGRLQSFAGKPGGGTPCDVIGDVITTGGSRPPTAPNGRGRDGGTMTMIVAMSITRMPP